MRFAETIRRDLKEMPKGDLTETDRKSSKVDSSNVERVARSDLALAYQSDPLVFNGINRGVQIIKNAGYHFDGKTKDVKNYEEFFDTIGEIGSHSSFEDLLSISFKNLFIFGNYFEELIPNDTKTKIVDLDFIDPITIDYQKDTNSQPILDKYGRPKNYVQTNELDSTKTERTIPAEWIAHFKLYNIGQGTYPIGLVEPVYLASYRKLQLEDAYVNSAYKTAFPRYKALIGDLQHEPTPDMIQKALDKLNNLKAGDNISAPYYFDFQPLQIASMGDNANDVLEYFNVLIAAGLGIPLAFLSGQGSSVNRSTLNDLKRMYEFSLTDTVVRTTIQRNQKVLDKLGAFNNWGKVKIMWDVIETEDRDERAKRFVNYAKFKVLPKELIQQEVIKAEGLIWDKPYVDEELEMEKLKVEASKNQKPPEEDKSEDDDKDEKEGKPNNE